MAAEGAPGLASGHEGDQGSSHRDWANEMPDALLCSIFDMILTAPTAHPSYLAQKAQNVWRLGSVCKAWRNAVRETSIGVCLPATLSEEVCTWVSKMMLRAIEFHDPEHTDPRVLQLLSNSELLARSSKSIISIIDAPCQRKSWSPSSFPNLIELVVWRPSSSRISPTFDARLIKDLSNLQYLVLASGFTGIKHMMSWPSSCKRLVWTCPSDAHSSKLSVPPIPPNISLQWISLRAYAVRIQDLSSILGRISELVIHAMYVFVTLPPSCYPSLCEAGSTAPVPPGVSSGNVKAWRKWKRDHDWAEEGLRTLSQMLVSDVGLLMFRLRFSRVLISQPLSGRFKDASWRMLGLHRGPGGDEGATSSDAGALPPPSSDEDEGHVRGSQRCASCGQPYNRLPDYSSSSEGGSDDEGGSGHGRGSDHGGHSSDEDYDDLMYDEVTPDQVMAAFKHSIEEYASMLAAQKPGFKAYRPPQRPAVPMPQRTSLAGRRGAGQRSSLDSCSAGSGAAKDLLLQPVDYSRVVPLLEGRHNPGQDREVTFTRKHQDPAEPARLRFEQPSGARGSLPLRAALPGLLNSTRPVQAVAFAPWPYASAEAVLGPEPFTPSTTTTAAAAVASPTAPTADTAPAAAAATAAAAPRAAPAAAAGGGAGTPSASASGHQDACKEEQPEKGQGSGDLHSHPVAWGSDSEDGEGGSGSGNSARVTAGATASSAATPSAMGAAPGDEWGAGGAGGGGAGGGGSGGGGAAAAAAAEGHADPDVRVSNAGPAGALHEAAGAGVEHAGPRLPCGPASSAAAAAAAAAAAGTAGTVGTVGAAAGTAGTAAAAAAGTAHGATADGAAGALEGACEQQEPQLTWQEEYGRLQRALITNPRFVSSSAATLHKINFLQLPHGWDPAKMRALFTPFAMLTKVSLITMDDPATALPPAILPVSVVKVAFHAGTPNQRFDAKVISNLTELWRLSLHGYSSLDLSAIPQVRPGLLLKIVEVPEREAPIGKPGVDVLMPKGRVVDMSLQVGTDASVSDVERMGAPFVAKVDITAWAPLCKDMNLRSPAGVELHYNTRSPFGLFEALRDSPLEQFTVCIATDLNGDIIAVPPSPPTVARRRAEGQRCPPVFAFVCASNSRMHGVHMAMMVKHGRVGRVWDLEVMDASIVDDEEGLLFFTFFKNDAAGSGAPPIPTGEAAPLSPLEPLGMALANAQMQLAHLQLLGQGQAGAEEALAAATAALAHPEFVDLFGSVPGEDDLGPAGDLLDDLD